MSDDPHDRPAPDEPERAPGVDGADLGDDDVDLPADEGVDAELGADPGSGAD